MLLVVIMMSMKWFLVLCNLMKQVPLMTLSMKQQVITFEVKSFVGN